MTISELRRDDDGPVQHQAFLFKKQVFTILDCKRTKARGRHIVTTGGRHSIALFKGKYGTVTSRPQVESPLLNSGSGGVPQNRSWLPCLRDEQE